MEYSGTNNKWTTFSIEIRSRFIKDVLRTVFAEYTPDVLDSAIDHDELPLTLKPPFRAFCHCWEKFEHQLETSSGEEKRHVQLLANILKPELQRAFESKKLYEKTGCTDFYGVGWNVQPGWTIIHHNSGTYSAGFLRDIKCKSNIRGHKWWDLTVNTLQYNGHQFGGREETWRISHFKGYRHLYEGSVFPLHCHPEKSKIHKTLSVRGEKFIELHGQHIKSYSDPHKRTVSERIIVDVRGYYCLNNMQSDYLLSLGKLDNFTTPEKEIHSTEHSRDTKDSFERPTESQRIYAVPKIKVFSLERKIWFDVRIDGIEDVEWNTSAIDNLILGQPEKEMIIGLTSSFKESTTTRFDDYTMSTKGTGIIMLLHGPPGTGKTLTAESLSEYLRRPLYVLGVEDLGTKSQEVEQNLEGALARCAWWNAILLIDESDVFLEKRTMDNLERTEIVSVFLRLIEYYGGIMIMTTNRIKTMDPAFESRIDLMLAYEGLDPAGRKALWRNVLSSPTLNMGQTVIAMEDSDYEILAGYPLNGRHIKSLANVAMRLAESRNEALKRQSLEEVIKIRVKALQDIEG
ncbi:P-loop containing nucleoside triphosphate hydrolase protein [Xylaria flabelliformis]|nr:P-loop containing nucleoside triphosphate hydrolase protein [Xylaria flabelliformis]